MSLCYDDDCSEKETKKESDTQESSETDYVKIIQMLTGLLEYTDRNFHLIQKYLHEHEKKIKEFEHKLTRFSITLQDETYSIRRDLKLSVPHHLMAESFKFGLKMSSELKEEFEDNDDE